MAREREWTLIVVWDWARIRTRLQTEKGDITDMMVQLEANDEDWHAVVRYNYAHGKPHMDKYHKDGRKEKIWLDHKNLEEAFAYAENNIRLNWRRLLWECGYREND